MIKIIKSIFSTVKSIEYLANKLSASQDTEEIFTTTLAIMIAIERLKLQLTLYPLLTIILYPYIYFKMNKVIKVMKNARSN